MTSRLNHVNVTTANEKKSFFVLDQVVRKTIKTTGWKVEQVLSFSDKKKFPVLMLCANLQAGKPKLQSENNWQKSTSLNYKSHFKIAANPQ